MNIREMRQHIRQRLTPYTGEGEAAAMSSIILEEVKGYTPTELLIHSERELLPETIERIDRIVNRICQGQPMQYVLGTSRFRGRDFKVVPGVLIPRPETAQLVDMIVDESAHIRDAAILDIGTGSGCIAISLAIDLPYAQVDAIDISDIALSTAADNATKLKTKVRLFKTDIYDTAGSTIDSRTYDIIVSNPPYVLQSERDSMEPRVKDYEPAEALFVTDSDPIGIYTAIAGYAKTHLCNGGRLYLEINPLCNVAISQMLNSMGFDDVEILPDFRGHKRFAKARL